MALARIKPAEPRELYEAIRSGRTGMERRGSVASEDDIRRLRLDNEDLKFECGRLKSAVAQAQAELLSLSERNGLLQRRLDRIQRFVPSWSVPLLRSLLRRLRGG